MASMIDMMTHQNQGVWTTGVPRIIACAMLLPTAGGEAHNGPWHLAGAEPAQVQQRLLALRRISEQRRADIDQQPDSGGRHQCTPPVHSGTAQNPVHSMTVSTTKPPGVRGAR
jgi:hypothetical protein